ncbi:MAG: RagB/SusD family nutrient uptake outer membrane protein [Odoribacteraceae bacterium]|jgi:hypothetical protein|nr:RagB/SusD family nutrient uptake outer membrane protein [Odoribacteraceae bacterium]
MKQIIALLAAASLNACHFLDIDPYITDLATMDSVFKRQEYVQQYLNNIYSHLPDPGTLVAGYALPWVLITDEGLVSYKRAGHPQNYFANNEVSPDNIYYDRWDAYYEGIRQANTFLRRLRECTEASDLKRQEWSGEALFVKALLYLELMLAWGPVPIVPDDPPSLDTPLERLHVERSTWDECSDRVTALLDEAIRLLPERYFDPTDVGKPTKNSARAALSRLTLYTASPLYNGENAEFASFVNAAGTPYLNPVKSSEKWAVAAIAAKRLVDLKPVDLYTVPAMHNTPAPPVPAADSAPFPDGVGGIDHYHSYSDMFTGACQLASANVEILFSRQHTSMNNSNSYAAPRVINGWGSMSVPQNLVDAYYMANGRDTGDATPDCPHDTGYTAADTTFSGIRGADGFTILAGTHRWYVNREPRFYATIAYNNSFYPSASTPPAMIDARDGRVAKFYLDARSGKEYASASTGSVEPEDYPMTGYLCRKFIGFEDSWWPGARQSRKYTIVYRMAEVFLNYVEAMNELDQPYTIDGITVARDPAEMKRCFNLVRYRAGLPGITDADVADRQRVRDLLLRERQIEFAWESRRYFDLRRTKQAVVHENAPLRGMNVDAPEARKDDFHTIVRVTQRDYTYKVFTNRQTFWPIPKTEMNKNPRLHQLPGY